MGLGLSMTHDIIVKQHGGRIDVATAPGQCRRCAHRRHVAAPINGAVEFAGPERLSLDEFARKFLTATKDPRKVVADNHARYFGAELDDRSLTPGDDPRLGSVRLEKWLSRSARNAH